MFTISPGLGILDSVISDITAGEEIEIIEEPRHRRGRPRNNEVNVDFGAHECWVQVLETDYLSVDAQLDSVIELVEFFLVEPISLAFFPYKK